MKTQTHESKVFEMKSQVKSKWNSLGRYQNESQGTELVRFNNIVRGLLGLLTLSIGGRERQSQRLSETDSFIFGEVKCTYFSTVFLLQECVVLGCATKYGSVVKNGWGGGA